MMKTHWRLLAGGLFLVLCACDNWNLPVKDEMDFYRAMTPVDGWTELKELVEHSGAALIVLTKGFPAGSAAISVTRPLTISAAPGTRAVITRTGGANPLFTVASGGSLTLGRPDGGILVLDGNKAELGSVGSSLIEMSGGFCTMRDGAELRNNRKNGSGGAVLAGGGAVFTMSGGIISGNAATNSGGGVYVYSSMSGVNVSFTMSGGTIEWNEAGGYGGGVYVSNDFPSRNTEFTMSGGSVSRNTVSGNGTVCGGGIYAGSNNGGITEFTMSGGSIGGNTASGTTASGGGVSVSSGGNVVFKKEQGGFIYGSNSDENSNTASTGGHAVSVGGSTPRKRNATAGEGVTLDSTQDGCWE